jgi:uncharacterized protein (TIGR03083 family)
MTTLTTDLAKTYHEARIRIADRARSLDAKQADTPVPACPGWKVHDVIAHLSGAAADFVDGNMDKAPSPEWTAAHVEAGTGRSLRQLLESWEGVAGQLESMIATAPDRSTFFVADVLCHEIDLCWALGWPIQRTGDDIEWLIVNFVRIVTRKVTAAGLPPLDFVSGSDSWVAGESGNGIHGIRVEVPSAFELVRAMTGRRSLTQIRAWNWQTDPDLYIPHLSAFTPRPDPLEE